MNAQLFDALSGTNAAPFQIWQCASLPVAAGGLATFTVWPGVTARMPAEGERLKLLEFAFDLMNYASKSATSMFAQFHDVLATR